MADWNEPSPKQGMPGDPKCERCKGHGVVPVEDAFPPRLRQCVCTHVREIALNVERGWPGLVRYSGRLPDGKVSALIKRLRQDLWITAPMSWLKTHFRSCAVRQPPNWSFKVVSDVDLMRAWLGSVPLMGKEIIDADAAQVSMRHLTLLDLIEPPGLLVIHLGIKAAANKEMPNVLLETLYHRSHLNKPTWLFHEPENPFDDTMRSYSMEAVSFTRHWERIQKIPKRSRTLAGASRQRTNTPVNQRGLAHAEELADEDELEPAYASREETEPEEEFEEFEDDDEMDEEFEDDDEMMEGVPDPAPSTARRRHSLSGGSGGTNTVEQPKKKERPKKKPWRRKKK